MKYSMGKVWQFNLDNHIQISCHVKFFKRHIKRFDEIFCLLLSPILAVYLFGSMFALDNTLLPISNHPTI